MHPQIEARDDTEVGACTTQRPEQLMVLVHFEDRTVYFCGPSCKERYDAGHSDMHR